MAHMLTSTDGLVLAGRPAWHGLGTVVETAPDPDQALKLAGLDWIVEKRQLFHTDPSLGVPVQAGDNWGLVRTDTGTTLGVVSGGYEPLLNRDIADMAWQLGRAVSADLPVTVESAGSLRGGADVFFLLRTESWRLGSDGRDEIRPYILMTTSHDGTASFRIMDTTVRVVCKNTLTSALGQEHGFKIRHTKEIRAYSTKAIEVLGLALKGLMKVGDAYKYIAGSRFSPEERELFIDRCYSHKAGPRPSPFSPLYNEWVLGRREFAKAFALAISAGDNVVGSTVGTKLQLVNAITYMEDHKNVVLRRGSVHGNAQGALVHRKLLGASSIATKRAALKAAVAL